MVQCASCKNKTSTDQCPSKAIKGLIFCGKHIKSKDKRIWAEINNGNKKAIMIQKYVRGFLLRNYLKLLGEGVFNRTRCHNDDEMVTLDEKTKSYPLDYFSFEEAGKLWWFDVRSLNHILRNNLRPENPYTRQKLTPETRKRLREVCRIRKRLGLFNLHDKPKETSLDEKLYKQWMHVSQIIEENGFFDTNPLFFMSMNKEQVNVFLNLIHKDLEAYASEHTTSNSRRKQYVQWNKNILSAISRRPSWRSFVCSYMASKTLLTILNDAKENYPICFIIMSALHRM